MFLALFLPYSILKFDLLFLNTAENGSGIFINMSISHSSSRISFLRANGDSSTLSSVCKVCFSHWHYSTHIYVAFPLFYHPITQYHEMMFLSCAVFLLP